MGGGGRGAISRVVTSPPPKPPHGYYNSQIIFPSVCRGAITGRKPGMGPRRIRKALSGVIACSHDSPARLININPHPLHYAAG